MKANRTGAGFARVIIGNQRQSGRNIKSLADAHQGSGGEQFPVGLDVSRPPRHCRPGKEAAADGEASAEPIGDPAAHRTQESVHPFELSEHPTPVGLRADVWNVCHHRAFHGCQHLAVEIIEQGDGSEQTHSEPGPARESRGWESIMGDEKRRGSTGA